MESLLAQASAEHQTTLMHWIISQGPWAFFTAVLLLLAYWGGRAFFTHVVLPLKDAAIDHLRGVSTALTKLGETLAYIQDKLTHVDDKTTVIMQEYQGFVDESKTDRAKIHERLDSLESKVHQVPKAMP